MYVVEFPFNRVVRKLSTAYYLTALQQIHSRSAQKEKYVLKF